jgi:hypothetical protein
MGESRFSDFINPLILQELDFDAEGVDLVLFQFDSAILDPTLFIGNELNLEPARVLLRIVLKG